MPRPTYTKTLSELTTYIKPTQAGAEAHTAALTALTQLHGRLVSIFTSVTYDGGVPKGSDFGAITMAIDEHGAVIGGLLKHPSPQATIAAITLNQVRMHATRAIGAKTAVGSPLTWANKLEEALMDLELANARAIAVADQLGEIT